MEELYSSTTSETSSTVVVEGRAATAGELVLFTVPAVGALVGSLVCCRDNLGGQRQVSAQVFDAFIGQIAIVILPRESDSNVSAGSQRLHQAHHFQIGGPLNLRVCGGLDRDERQREDQNLNSRNKLLVQATKTIPWGPS